MVIEPAVGSISRLMWRIKVDLPEPERAHDHLDLARRHRDVDVVQAKNVLVTLAKLGLAHATLDRLDISLRV